MPNSMLSSENISPQFNKSSYNVWFLKINDPSQQRALWLRFASLVSANGFRRVAENWAVFFQRTAQDEVRKTALKQSFDLATSMQKEPQPDLQIGNSTLSAHRTQGQIHSKGNSMSWDLQLSPIQNISFDPIPERFQKFHLIRNSFSTPVENLAVSGTATINGEKFEWKDAPAMMGHRFGARNAHSWVWGHCNTFKNEQGQYTDFTFEGLSARQKLGPFISPPVSAFFFYYQGKPYIFNSLRRLLQIKSTTNLNEWTFEAGKDDLSFRGYLKAEHKDFSGLSFEDTNGSLIYCSTSLLSNMRVLVYRSGKLETTLQSTGTASMEVASRDRNPYVPLSI